MADHVIENHDFHKSRQITTTDVQLRQSMISHPCTDLVKYNSSTIFSSTDVIDFRNIVSNLRPDAAFKAHSSTNDLIQSGTTQNSSKTGWSMITERTTAHEENEHIVDDNDDRGMMAPSAIAKDDDYLGRLPSEVRRMIWKLLLIWPKEMDVDRGYRRESVEGRWRGTATQDQIDDIRYYIQTYGLKKGLECLERDALRKNDSAEIEGVEVSFYVDSAYAWDPATNVPPQVINLSYTFFRGFDGLGLLRTCKWIEEATTKVLYAENIIHVSTRSTANPNSRCPSISMSPINGQTWSAYRQSAEKSFSTANMTVRTLEPPKYLTASQLDEIFDRTLHPSKSRHYMPNQHSFLHTKKAWENSDMNPLPQFFHEIGPLNASKIRKLTLYDNHWTKLLDCRPDYHYTWLLCDVVPELQELTLKQVSRGPKPSDATLLSDEEADDAEHEIPQDKLGSDEPSRAVVKRNRKVSKAVGTMVTELKSLKKLTLTFNYKGMNLPHPLHWGVANRWVKFVDERNKAPTAPA